MEFIEALSKEVAISVGHTCADFDTAKEAFDKGASHGKSINPGRI